MEARRNLYERYTSTSSLAPGVDEEAVLVWSKSYFRTHYSQLLPTDKKAHILEVGCGYGRYIQALLEMGYSGCYGIDLSDEQISYAKTTLGLNNVEQADALNWLHGKEGIFDCILALDVLEHFETGDLLKLGKKLHGALKPGGRIIVQVPNGISPLNPVPYGDLTHMRAFTPQSMQQFFLLVGFLPCGYFEIPPHIHGVQSAIRRLLWMGVVKPLISFLIRIMQGRMLGGDIYTSNFIAVAKRNTVHDLL